VCGGKTIMMIQKPTAWLLLRLILKTSTQSYANVNDKHCKQ